MNFKTCMKCWCVRGKENVLSATRTKGQSYVFADVIGDELFDRSCHLIIIKHGAAIQACKTSTVQADTTTNDSQTNDTGNRRHSVRMPTKQHKETSTSGTQGTVAGQNRRPQKQHIVHQYHYYQQPKTLSA